MATNFLMFCSTSSDGLDLALGAGVVGFEFAAGNMYTDSRGGNRAGRAGLGRANTGPGQNRAGPKLARFFRAKILTAQPALKTGPVGPNSHFKEKKNSGGPGHTGPSQIWPGFFGPKFNGPAQP